MNVVEETDTTTGTIRVYSQDTGTGRSKKSGKLLATSAADGSWQLDNESEFRRVYNNAQRRQGKQTLGENEFKKEFYISGAKQFNLDRAEVLNEKTNYTNEEEYERSTSSFSSAGTPYVKDASTGTQNNSEGQQVADPDKNNNNDEVAVSSFGFFDNITPVSDLGTGGSDANLRYPLDRVPDLEYDFVTFTAHEYTAGQLTTVTGEERVGPRMESITLPILPNIEEANGIEWGEDKLNMIQKMGAEIAADTIGADNVGEALVNLASGTADAVDKILKENGDLRDRIISHFAGQAVGANVLGRSTGAVLNPNLELLFKGPQLRVFNFSFKLRPRYEDEAAMCKKIIKAFKRNMHVQRGTSGLFLTTPNIFKIQYYWKGGEHPYLNRIKPCALTNFKVGYTPDNNYMTYSDGSMTGYDITMTFAEIVPVYADQINESGGTGF